MSRRREEFAHRTSIFEGAFRAWSHLASFDPEMLHSSSAEDLDPLDGKKVPNTSESSQSGEKNYAYEPLPRTGLAHPFVQAIMSPWLGPDADKDSLDLGISTLRTWWQHRRKGETNSALKIRMQSDKFQQVLEQYTRHFFQLAYCLVVHDREAPPRSLHAKMKEWNKQQQQQQRQQQQAVGDRTLHGLDIYGTAVQAAAQFSSSFDGNSNISPLERLHHAQRQQIQELTGVGSSIIEPGNPSQQQQHGGFKPAIDIRGKCVPGKLDLEGIVDSVNRQATQLAHRGGSGANPNSGSKGYKDADTKCPIVLCSPPDGNAPGPMVAQISLSVDGIVCAHCVKIVETVLRGCDPVNKGSPINGLVDAVADQSCQAVLIRIAIQDGIHNNDGFGSDGSLRETAQRVAFEAARNLQLVGYKAQAKEFDLAAANEQVQAQIPTVDKKTMADLDTAFRTVGNVVETSIFDWGRPCECPASGVRVGACERHSNMSNAIFYMFETREQEVLGFWKYGPENLKQQRQTYSGMQQQSLVQNSSSVMYGESRQPLAMGNNYIGHQQNSIDLAPLPIGSTVGGNGFQGTHGSYNNSNDNGADPYLNDYSEQTARMGNVTTFNENHNNNMSQEERMYASTSIHEEPPALSNDFGSFPDLLLLDNDNAGSADNNVNADAAAGRHSLLLPHPIPHQRSQQKHDAHLPGRNPTNFMSYVENGANANPPSNGMNAAGMTDFNNNNNANYNYNGGAAAVNGISMDMFVEDKTMITDLFPDHLDMDKQQNTTQHGQVNPGTVDETELPIEQNMNFSSF